MKEEQLLKQKFGSQRPFKVPEGYFDSLEKSLMQNVVEPAVPNKRPAIKAFMRPLKWAACFAAVLLVSGTIYFNSLEKESYQNHADNISENMSSSVYADYILDEISDYAMLDNDDIYSYVEMNDNNKMRRFIICLFFILAFNISDAQNKNRHFTPERFQAELEQYITRKAGLSPKEASKFFPLYSEMLRKQRSIHDELKKLKRIKPTTDAECKKNLMKRDKCEIEIKQLQKTYHEKFMQILPAGKVYDIVKAEERFHRQIFKRAADKMRHKKK